MTALIKIDIINRYEKEIEVYQGKKKVKIPKYYCRIGESVEIITVNAGEWSIAVIVENKNKERFVVKWKDLKIISEFNFNFDF